MGNNIVVSRVRSSEFLDAAKAGNDKVVIAGLSRKLKLLYSAQTWSGQTCWHVSSRHGNLSTLKCLTSILMNGLTGPWTKEDLRPLHKLGHDVNSILKRLVDDQDCKGMTPLMVACIHGHKHCIEYLMSLGADPFILDHQGRTCMHYAASLNHGDCIQVLVGAVSSEPRLRHGESRDLLMASDASRLINVPTPSGFTPLHYAVWAGAVDSLQALLSYDAELCAQNTRVEQEWILCGLGYTPLHLAALKGDEVCVRLLLGAHAQALSASSDVMGPHSLAAHQPEQADPRRIRNRRGLMPYHVAVSRNFDHITELLHPDVPYTFILDNDDLRSTRLYGPPRLAVLAAAALQKKLLADIASVESRMVAKSGSRLEAEDSAKDTRWQDEVQYRKSKQVEACPLNRSSSGEVKAQGNGDAEGRQKQQPHSHDHGHESISPQEEMHHRLEEGGSRSVGSPAETPSVKQDECGIKGEEPLLLASPFSSVAARTFSSDPMESRPDLETAGSSPPHESTGTTQQRYAVNVSASTSSAPVSDSLGRRWSTRKEMSLKSRRLRAFHSSGNLGLRRGESPMVRESLMKEQPLGSSVEVVLSRAGTDLDAMRNRYRLLRLSSGVMAGTGVGDVSSHSAPERSHLLDVSVHFARTMELSVHSARALDRSVRAGRGVDRSARSSYGLDRSVRSCSSMIRIDRSQSTPLMMTRCSGSSSPGEDETLQSSIVSPTSSMRIGGDLRDGLCYIPERGGDIAWGTQVETVREDEEERSTGTCCGDGAVELESQGDCDGGGLRRQVSVLVVEEWVRSNSLLGGGGPLEDEEEEDNVCEVCFDRLSNVLIAPCLHRLCEDCCRELCKLHHFKPALCPFCRCMISAFEMAEHH